MAEDSEQREINILVLGETGVGKSTWINSFANYLQYESLEEAEKNEILTVIPTSFTITDDNYEERIINTGSHRNEVQRAGESATQRPRTYTFPYNELNIRIIDTPGIGDSRGPQQDKMNFQMIMDHLAFYKEVHGICILLKPNNARITVLFEFCIKHLLTHLHKDAIRNIVFCFTNARNTFYRPGGTLPALRQLLSNYQDLEIALDKSTMYCLDNESIQFLAAIQAGLNFDDQRDVYAKSWDVSAKETHRLLDHIIQLEPHVLQNTLSLNDARRIVIGLTKPLADIGQNIRKNIREAEKKLTEVVNSKADRQIIEKNLFIPVVSFSLVYLDKPYQVCTLSKCCKEITLDNGEPSTQHSCRKPTQKSVFKFNVFRPKACSRCGCPKANHTDIQYEIKEVLKQEKCHVLEESMKNLDRNIESIMGNFMEEIMERIRNLEKEHADILKISSQFAYFLKENAIAPYNDTMVRYLEQQIETAKLNSSKDASLQQKQSVELLTKMKTDYEKEVQVLTEKIENAKTEEIKCWQIPVLKQELIDLPINGPHIRDILNGQESMPATALGADEQIVRVKKQKGKKIGKKTLFGFVVAKTATDKQLKKAKNSIKRDQHQDRGQKLPPPPPDQKSKPNSKPIAAKRSNVKQSEGISSGKPAGAGISSRMTFETHPTNSDMRTLTRQAAQNSDWDFKDNYEKPRSPSPSVPLRAERVPVVAQQASKANIPPPPPPPLDPDFLTTAGTVVVADAARSALLDQIRNGKALNKVNIGTSHLKESPKKQLASQSFSAGQKQDEGKGNLNEALKRALSERYKAHHADPSEMTFDFDDDANVGDVEEWL